MSYSEHRFKIISKSDSIYFYDTICHVINPGTRIKLKSDALKLQYGDYSFFQI